MIHLLINPHSGKGRGEQIGLFVEDVLLKRRIPFTKHVTAYAGHAPDLTRHAVQSGCTKLLAVGGDGTMGEVTQSLMGTDIVLGIIPAGTGNDYIKTLGISRYPEQALETALGNNVDAVDVIRINDRACLNIASVGIDATTAYYTNRSKFFRGQLAYVYGLLKAYFMAKLPQFTYSIDGGTSEHTSCTLAVFANGQFYGGGFNPIPFSKHNDGVMDVLLVDKLSRPRILPLIISYAKGKHVQWSICHFHRCQNFKLKSDATPLIFNVDGEIIEASDFNIQLMPRSLKVAVPSLDDANAT